MKVVEFKKVSDITDINYDDGTYAVPYGGGFVQNMDGRYVKLEDVREIAEAAWNHILLEDFNMTFIEWFNQYMKENG